MILYHAITNYHILEMMLYKKMFHEDETVILILPDFIKHKLPFYMDLEEQGFFDKVYEFPYWYNRVEFAEDESSIERVFREIVGVGIEEFNEIYIAGAQYPITKYILSENRKFYNIEDGSGTLSRYKYFIEALTKLDYSMGTWCQENEIVSGRNKNIIKNICNVSAQRIKLEIDNIIDFNVTEVLKCTNKAYIDKIKVFFKAPENLCLDEKTALLLTQHFANVQIMSAKEQIHMYQLIIDFYAQAYNIIIKKHPDDWVKYEDDLQNVQQINSLFPSELLPYISTEGHFDVAITVNSCSAANITEFIPKLIFGGNEFRHRYKEIFKIYYTLKLIEKSTNDKIVFLNVYEEIVKNLVMYSGIKLNLSNMIFIDNIEELELDAISDAVVVLGKGINNDKVNEILIELNKINFELFLLGTEYNNDIVREFTKFKIEKTKIKEKVIDDLLNEYIYAKINYDYINTEIFRTLEQTGIKTTLTVEK